MNPDPPPCMTRRQFLLKMGAGAAGTVVAVRLGDLFVGRVLAQDAGRTVRLAAYPRRRIGSLSALQVDTPVEFSYPGDDPLHKSYLVKLGRRAGGGIGPGQDVVAFNTFCTHQGGPLAGVYQARHKVLGPCPLHLTTFDLTRHGMVVAGHATENLPQVVLEAEGDDIHATGVMGLIYGHDRNIR
ncbi:MAG: arsenate reductase (azurin) small subunit [Euryarchaeota archaeon]|nr:arsenate reductase (azurin) small subunit [Euryarchaeota archaeon]